MAYRQSSLGGGIAAKDTLIKASSAVSWPFSCLPEPLFPHISSERLRKIVSEIHRNCLRFRQASFNQRIPNVVFA